MVASYEQGYNTRAKQSTRLLAIGASITACTTDLAQYLTNLTAGTSSVYESSSARLSVSTSRTIVVEVSMTSANTGTLWHNPHGTSVERLEFSAANTLRIRVNGSNIGTLAVTAPTGTDVCVVAWVTEPNPDTTGAGDAARSQIVHWNVTDGTHDRSAWMTHAAISTGTGTATWGADDNTGTAAFAGTITGILFEARLMSGAEIAADWVQTRLAVSGDVEVVHRGIPIEPDTFDAAGYYHGPSALLAADATRRLIRGTFSPLVNVRYNVEPVWSAALLTGNAAIRGAPNDNDWRMHRSWSSIVPVPPTASHVWARVQVRTYVTSGAAVPLGLRLYSMARRPGMQLDDTPPGVAPYYAGATITRDDTSTGLGQYTTLGLVPISRGRGRMEGRTCLALAVQVDPAAASANDAAARFVIRALHVVPVYYAPEGGLGNGGLAP